jgi:threonine dehydratase
VQAGKSGVVGLGDVRAARERIGTDIHRTPLLSSRLLGEAAGGHVLLKCENLQRTGSFKARGALNAVRSLTREERARGVTTYSSGNHGQALAWAGGLEQTRVVLFVPVTAPSVKIDAARAYGADVRPVGTTLTERQIAAEQLALDENLILVPPFDDPRVIAGQGTCGLELAEDAPDFDLLIAPVGGGGLVAGLAVALGALRPSTEVVGVEPRNANAMTAALAAGRPVTIPPPATIADGLMAQRVGELPFSIARERLSTTVLVDDTTILDAVRFLLTRARLVAEPSGAVGVAALLAGSLPLAGRTAIVVVSGGNLDPSLLAALTKP